MNCQDIVLIVDRRPFGSLTDVERRECEAHSLECRHCLPVWSAHARVAAMPVPPMPTDLATHFRMLATVGAQARVPLFSPRRRALIAGVFVLAAAAAMLAVNFSNALSPVPQTANLAPDAAAAETPPLLESAATNAAPVPAPAQQSPPVSAGLPLLPAPLDADRMKIEHRNTAIQKAVDLYPEMVQGPEVQDDFAVSLILRADGTVVSSTKRTASRASPEKFWNIMREYSESLPSDAGYASTATAWKGRKTPDGRVLRGDLNVMFKLVTTSYDASRSSERVKEIVRANRPSLGGAAGGSGTTVLNVFLSEGGGIQREKLEYRQAADVNGAPPDKPEEVANRAKELASKLGVSVSDIGLMGVAYLQEPYLTVNYAWLRRPAETAPTFGQALDIGGLKPALNLGFDVAAASVIAERLMPEVFSRQARLPEHPSDLLPALILTEEGEVIRTAAVYDESEFKRQMQNLIPGFVTVSTRLAYVTNSAGKSAPVQLIWQASPTSKERIEKERAAEAISRNP